MLINEFSLTGTSWLNPPYAAEVPSPGEFSLATQKIIRDKTEVLHVMKGDVA